MPGRALDVFSNGQQVGQLREEEDVWAFEYASAWQERPDAFDLSPALPRAHALHRDGASLRPVQWYFDNLLPEEHLRVVLAREAKLAAEDAFGLLVYFGAESAGSLVLRSPGGAPDVQKGMRPLPLEELSRRIANLPRVSLMRDAPKRMSLAGAQHKLLVNLRDGVLYEPLPASPSTHILKPNHPEAAYPASVVNEYFTMRLARAARLAVPQVHRLYVPQPVYLVERFDRAAAANGGEPLRLHAIDTCQLLNKSRAFKYTASQVDVLAHAIALCRSRAAARLQIFRWIVFNLLVGNGDNHLKNLSFLVRETGIELAPAYDLLSTAVYDTRALAAEGANWPHTSLTLPLSDARRFSDVKRRHVIEAGAVLGLRASTADRELDSLLNSLQRTVDPLLQEIEAETKAAVAGSPDPAAAGAYLAGEQRLLAAWRNIVFAEMARQLR